MGRFMRSAMAACLLAVGGVSVYAQGSSPDAERAAIAPLIKQGEHTRALEAIDAGLARSPADPRLWTLRGLALTGLKRPAEALAAYHKALALEPRSMAALQGAAEIEYRTRRPEARQTVERIIAIDPDNRVAHGMLGALAFERRDCEVAVAAFERSGPADRAERRSPRAVRALSLCRRAVSRCCRHVRPAPAPVARRHRGRV